jgi:L,D-peptidoglycan transpeptidase YkuD (ErfK/YbiS/YcfS/YnhG family)
LLGERLAQVLIVVGDQNGTDLGHRIFPRRFPNGVNAGKQAAAWPLPSLGKDKQRVKMRKAPPSEFRQVSRGLTRLRVVAAPRLSPGQQPRGRLIAGATQIPCAIGRSGIGRGKFEGDGKTPAGCFAILWFYFRPDSGFRPRRNFRALPLRRDSAWCDDPGDRNYNRPVRLPYGRSREGMWRDDRLYDIVGVLEYNIRPRVDRRGSAIFFHLARKDLSPTAGCVALRAADMRRLLPQLSREVAMVIG